MRRAREMGISNIVPTRGEAQALLYPDRHFDSTYLIATLDEVSDKERVLRELRRVLKHDGWMVLGEVLLDPHRVSLDKLLGWRTLLGWSTSERLRAGSGTSLPSGLFRSSARCCRLQISDNVT